MTDVHIRTALRRAIQAALVGKTAAGANVLMARTASLDDSRLPCLLIYSRTEKSGFEGMGSDTERSLARLPQIMVVGCVRVVGDEADDALDALATEIESTLAAAMEADQLGGLSDRLELITTDFDVPGPAPGQPHDKRQGRIGLLYRCEVTTAAGDPTSRN